MCERGEQTCSNVDESSAGPDFRHTVGFAAEPWSQCEANLVSCTNKSVREPGTAGKPHHNPSRERFG